MPAKIPYFERRPAPKTLRIRKGNVRLSQESETGIVTGVSSDVLAQQFSNGSVSFHWQVPPVSLKISVKHVLLHHSLRDEEGTVEGNGVAHYVDEAVAVMIKKREYHLL